MAAPSWWIEGDFVAFRQPLGNFDPVRGALTYLHLPAFELVLMRHEANLAVLFGDHGLVGDSEHILAMRQGDLDLCGHARFEPLPGSVELDDPPKIPNVLATIRLLHGNLIDRGDFAFEDDLRKGFEPDLCPHPGSDSIHDGFIEGDLDFHFCQVGQIKELLFLSDGQPLLDGPILGIWPAPTPTRILDIIDDAIMGGADRAAFELLLE